MTAEIDALRAEVKRLDAAVAKAELNAGFWRTRFRATWDELQSAEYRARKAELNAGTAHPRDDAMLATVEGDVASLIRSLHERAQQAESTRDAAQARATACEERARRAEAERDAMLEGHERLTPGELMRKGGEWLGAARSWIQRKARNGDSVTWGSLDVLERDFTVEDIEHLAAEVASAAMRPQPTEERLSSALRIQWRAEQQASDAAALLIAAETQLAEWRARAQAGAELVTDSSHIDDHMHESRSLSDIREWADSVLAWTIDPAAGTGDHERGPGRMGE